MPTRSDPQPRPAHLNRPWDLNTKTFSPRSDALGLQFSEQANELPPATRGSGLELGWGGMKSGWCPGSPPCPRTALPNRAQPRNLENLRIAEWRAWRISTLHSFPHHPCQPWGSRARIVKRLGRWLGIFFRFAPVFGETDEGWRDAKSGLGRKGKAERVVMAKASQQASR